MPAAQRATIAAMSEPVAPSAADAGPWPHGSHCFVPMADVPGALPRDAVRRLRQALR